MCGSVFVVLTQDEQALKAFFDDVDDKSNPAPFLGYVCGVQTLTLHLGRTPYTVVQRFYYLDRHPMFNGMIYLMTM